MMTAMLTAQNILAGERIHDVWDVNEDAEYHESGASGVKRRSAANASFHSAYPLPLTAARRPDTKSLRFSRHQRFSGGGRAD